MRFLARQSLVLYENTFVLYSLQYQITHCLKVDTCTQTHSLAHKHTVLCACPTSINVKTFQKVYGIFSLEENFHPSTQIFDTYSNCFAMKLIEEPSVLGNSIGACCFVMILPKIVSYSHHVPLGSQNKVLVDQNMQKIASNISVRISCLSHYFIAFAWTYQHQLFDFAWPTAPPTLELS